MNTEKCLNCNEDAKLFFTIDYLSKNYECENCGKISCYKYKMVVDYAIVKDDPKTRSFKKLQK